MSDIRRTFSVTVKMTPRQAIEAAEALTRAAVYTQNGRLYSAAHRITSGLWDAGWERDDEKREWRHA